MVKPSVLALVPARGGSKSIPRKNLRFLGGIPLIGYSIAAGRTARHVDRVIVSTDDAEIAEVARRFGAEVPFLRPSALAEDATTDLPVFAHALDWLREREGWRPDIVVQLRPTSPIRPIDCVDAGIEQLVADPAADSVRGVVVAGQNPYKMWRIDEDDVLSPLLKCGILEAYNQPRQALPTSYWQTGHIDVIRTSTISRGSMTGRRVRPLIIDPAYTCDIDTEADLERLESRLRTFDRPFVRPGAPANPFPRDLRLLVLDFDGVLTDNRVWTSGDGQEWVSCDRGDGLGLSTLRDLGVEVLVLSTEQHPVVSARCRKLELECIQGVANKGEALEHLMTARGVLPSQVIYVGNDINDLACLRLAGCSVAVADAHPRVIANADVILSRRGGFGAVRELCDLLTPQLVSSSQTT